MDTTGHVATRICRPHGRAEPQPLDCGQIGTARGAYGRVRRMPAVGVRGHAHRRRPRRHPPPYFTPIACRGEPAASFVTSGSSGSLAEAVGTHERGVGERSLSDRQLRQQLSDARGVFRAVARVPTRDHDAVVERMATDDELLIG